MEETKPEAPAPPSVAPPETPEPPASPVPQEPPPSRGTQTPADRALEAEGGEVLPEGFSPQAGEPQKLRLDELRPLVEVVGDPPPEATDAPTKRVIEVQGGPEAGPAPPGIEPPPEISDEQKAFMATLNASVNLETNVYNACYGAVHTLVGYLLQSQPQDSAELGASMFGGGQRTPLEMAEPQIALEVYRSVRQQMREDEKARQDALKGRGLLRKVLGVLFGR